MRFALVLLCLSCGAEPLHLLPPMPVDEQVDSSALNTETRDVADEAIGIWSEHGLHFVVGHDDSITLLPKAGMGASIELHDYGTLIFIGERDPSGTLDVPCVTAHYFGLAVHLMNDGDGLLGSGYMHRVGPCPWTASDQRALCRRFDLCD